MRHMIEIQDLKGCPSPLEMIVGDLVSMPAFGGRVLAGEGAVELLGPFLPAVFDPEGHVVAPMGIPGTLLMLARQPGRAEVELFTGDAFHAARSVRVQLRIAAVQE